MATYSDKIHWNRNMVAFTPNQSKDLWKSQTGEDLYSDTPQVRLQSFQKGEYVLDNYENENKSYMKMDGSINEKNKNQLRDPTLASDFLKRDYRKSMIGQISHMTGIDEQPAVNMYQVDNIFKKTLYQDNLAQTNHYQEDPRVPQREEADQIRLEPLMYVKPVRTVAEFNQAEFLKKRGASTYGVPLYAD